MAVRRERTRPASVFVELVRLAVVVLATGAAYELIRADLATPLRDLGEPMVLLAICLGAAVGYVVGGTFGRFALGRVDAAERHLRHVSSGELLAATIGGLIGLVVGLAVTWPVLLLDGRVFTVPLAIIVVALAITTGLRIGLGRGGDLLRLLGASGRLAVTSPALGPKARIVDTSALIDGRLLDVTRGGFLDGTLVIPRFVLYELQGLADAAEDGRRMRGRRGLDVLAGLQRASRVAVEVAEQDHPEISDVDAKLVALALERGSPLLTVDGNLARIAEVQGVRVLNLHQLAEDLRPPVLPGDRLAVRIVKPGKEADQGVGYLADGTMVVVEGGRAEQGSEVSAEVTSILSTSKGRMVFATLRPEPGSGDATPLARHGRDAGASSPGAERRAAAGG